MQKSISLLLISMLSVPLAVGAQPAGYGPPPQLPADDNVRLVYADVLRVDPIYDVVRVVRGCGPKFVKVGSRVCYQHNDLGQWIAAQTRSSTAHHTVVMAGGR